MTEHCGILWKVSGLDEQTGVLVWVSKVAGGWLITAPWSLSLLLGSHSDLGRAPADCAGPELS